MEYQNAPTSDDLQDILEAQSENEDFEQTNEDLQDDGEYDEDDDHEEYEDEPKEQPTKEPKELIKFSVCSHKFLEKLNLVMGVIPSNPILPILENFLLTESYIIGSDLQTAISVQLPMVNGLGDEKFSIAVPARMFRDWLRRLPKQIICITVDLNAHGIEVRSDNGKYTFACEDGGDFPRPATQKDCTQLMFNQCEFIEAVKGMKNFVSSDEMKPAMNGILMEFKNDLCTFVATDSHKMKTYSIDYKWEWEAFSVLPNGNALNQLVSIATTKDNKKDLSFSFNETNFFMYFDGGVEIVSRIIDEKFPDYKNVIPQNGKLIKEKILLSVPRIDIWEARRKTVLDSFLKTVVIDRVQLIQTIKRSQLFANRTSQQLRIKIDFDSYDIDVIAEDVDFSNESKEFLPTKNFSLLQSKSIEIGFNAKFLLTCLEGFDSDNITLYLSEPNRACLIEGDRELETVLIMPVMLNNYY